MKPGDLRDKLTVQASTVTFNPSNEAVETWSTFCTPWGHVEALGGEEHSLVAAQHNETEVRYTVTLRSDPETQLITSGMRILWEAPGGSITLNISAVLRSQTRDSVLLLAEERPR